MISDPCATPAALAKLAAYWFRELDAADETELEEHLFACAECGARLRQLVQLGDGTKRAIREGHLRAVLPAPFVRALKESGVRVREYRLEPGGSVLCTVTPEDDLVIAHLHAPLQDVRRLDVAIHDVTAGANWRFEDVAFDSTADEVVMLPNVAELRRLTYATQHVKLLAVDSTTERVIAEYTFNHSPYTSAPPAASDA